MSKPLVGIESAWNFAALRPEETELAPIFCDWDNRPMGWAAAFLNREWAKREMYCSDACAVMAEWHAPERR